MSLEVRIDYNRLPDLLRESPAALDRGIEALAEMGRGRAVQLVQTQSKGTTEKRYSPTRTVVVSKPGDAPNTDTGYLAGSITVQPAGHLARRIAVGAEYGEHLEFGTPNMPARPFMTPTVEWLRPRIPGVMKSVGAALERIAAGQSAGMIGDANSAE